MYNKLRRIRLHMRNYWKKAVAMLTAAALFAVIPGTVSEAAVSPAQAIA